MHRVAGRSSRLLGFQLDHVALGLHAFTNDCIVDLIFRFHGS